MTTKTASYSIPNFMKQIIFFSLSYILPAPKPNYLVIFLKDLIGSMILIKRRD